MEETIMNNDKKKTKFLKKTDPNGFLVTQCLNKSNEEQILAIMAENVDEKFEEPFFLEKGIVVSIPYPSNKNRTKISVWYSNNEDKENISSIIQSFFEWRFPKLQINKKTTMEVNKDGILTINNKKDK